MGQQVAYNQGMVYMQPQVIILNMLDDLLVGYVIWSGLYV
jgi:hypothetical protein